MRSNSGRNWSTRAILQRRQHRGGSRAGSSLEHTVSQALDAAVGPAAGWSREAGAALQRPSRPQPASPSVRAVLLACASAAVPLAHTAVLLAAQYCCCMLGRDRERCMAAPPWPPPPGRSREARALSSS